MVSIESSSNQPEAQHPVFNRRTFLQAALATTAVVGVGSFLTACGVKTQKVVSKLIRVGWKADMDTFNPFTTVTTEGVEIQSMIYDKLLDYGLDLQSEPSLATKSVSAGNTITYTIRDGVTWHDGTPFSVKDIVYTYETIGKNKLGINAQFLADYVSVSAPDDKTVVLTFTRPQAFDPGLVIPIVPAHIWSTKSTDEISKFDNLAPIGTGPFAFGTRKQGQIVTVTRNDKWWGTAPEASGISWAIYSNDDLLAQALKNGEVDITPNVPPTVFDGLKKDSAVTAVELDSFSFHHIGMNVSKVKGSTGNPLMHDRAIRQALGYALDRNQIVQIAYAGHALPAGSILTPNFGDYYYEPKGDAVIDNNPAKANAILDAAGYSAKGSDGIRKTKDGKSLSFRVICTATTSVDVRTAQLFQATAEKVGIKLTLTTVDSDTMASAVYNLENPDWDIFVWGWDSGVNDPSYLLGVPLTSQIGGNNDVFYSNPVYDDLCTKQSAELDHTKRVAIVQEMQKLFYEDCVYLVAVYLKKLQAYNNSGWTGWTNVAGGIIFNFTRDNYLKVKAGK